jgi:hypothetical protein
MSIWNFFFETLLPAPTPFSGKLVSVTNLWNKLTYLNISVYIVCEMEKTSE